jgi:hypothetical protein
LAATVSKTITTKASINSKTVPTRQTHSSGAENFNKNLQDFRDRRRNKRKQGGQWRQEGYPNRTTADYVKQIASPDTAAGTRRTLLGALQQELKETEVDDDGDDEDTLEIERKPQAKRKGKERRGMTFISFRMVKPGRPNTNTPQGISFFNSQSKQFKFDICDTLPFMKLPIGRGTDEDDKSYLSGLYDSGGCCTMGWLEYHEMIHTKHPQYVREFICLEEGQFENIAIGGIKDSVAITHMIEYWLPYADKGANATITLGLTADLPINTLFGLPFQIKAKMKADFNKQVVYSKIFHDTFSLEMKIPERVPIESLDYKHRTHRVMITESSPAFQKE